MAQVQTLLIHHAARRAHSHPPSSLAALSECLEAGARAIEIDITPLADGDFVLAHDDRLEAFSDGNGPVAGATAAQVRSLFYRSDGAITGEPVGLLSQAVTLLEAPSGPVELQLDLKPNAPLTRIVLASLVRLVQPVRGRILVSTVADWAVRGLCALDLELALGFDPLLYLDTGRSDDMGRKPPWRMGAYNYLDDHPLAFVRWGSEADYLAARAEALMIQAPAAKVWYISAALLARVLDDGFDWITFLHERDVQVAAWTLDPDSPHHVDLARHLIRAGVDRITTNDAPGMAALLGAQAWS